MTIKPDYWLSLPKTERQKQIQLLFDGQSEIDFIDLVKCGQLGIYASLGVHFDFAIFGRDSIQVAEDLLETHPNLSRQIIHVLANFQGDKTDAKSEEEPGKIHHEYRSKVFNGQLVPEVSLNILKRLQQSWGDENSQAVCYYGTADATPLYIKLVGAYVKRYGQKILDEIYATAGGQKRIADSVHVAASWLANKVETSSWSLLEFKRLNWEAGIVNQVWKDSDTSYLHLDGTIANHDSGIASIELQGYAYDALHVASSLVARSAEERQNWRELATQLKQQAIERMWMPNQKFFAQGLDRSPEGHTRRIETLTSNGAAILDSSLLVDLPASQKQSIIEGITDMLLSPEFSTPVGIRSRALKHKQMPGFIDYHGSYTVWPKETFTIARGLERYGQTKLADKLKTSILNGVKEAGEFYEFFYVNDSGQVWYDREEAVKFFMGEGLADNIALPESGQAWTISAVLNILANK